MDNIYVAGTDTGVGKTVLSLLLMQFFLARGLRPFYLKPLQTGCQDAYAPDSDAAFIYHHVAALKDKNPAASVLYCFPNPKAPFFAARDAADREINLAFIGAAVAEKGRHYAPLIIEAAGGLLVPVTDKTLMVDMIPKTGAKVVLAARAGLGTINHTLLSVEALRTRKIEPMGVVFIDQAGTPTEMITENMEAVQKFSGIKVAGVIGKIHDFDQPPEGCYHPLEFLMKK